MERPRRFVAVDLGATSGRISTARVSAEPGAELLTLEEVHRFPNAGVRAEDGSLRWDIEGIFEQVLEGLTRAAALGPVDSIGIDSWAVDYGLLDAEDRLLGAPYSHRDGRTGGVVDRVESLIGADRLYAVTGLQRLPFNTINQLVAAEDNGDLAEARTLLLLPDLLAFWLTGVKVAEVTNASTTQFFDAATRSWAPELLDRLEIDPDLLPPLVKPGTVIGTLLPEIAARVGLTDTVPVVAVGSHDTASAVVGVPAGRRPFAYLSSGTWSLVGVELDQPVLTEAARLANFTNEAGVDGTVRLLRNVMGLWVLTQCLDELGVAVTDALEAAEVVEPVRSLIDINDPALLPPGDMVGRVRALTASHGDPIPQSVGEITRCVLESLAIAYRQAVREVSELSGVPVEVLHIVGGGSNNALLCQLTADAVELPVTAGPAEASTMGNVLIQARADVVPLSHLGAMRALIRRTHSVAEYLPRTGLNWAAAEERVRKG